MIIIRWWRRKWRWRWRWRWKWRWKWDDLKLANPLPGHTVFISFLQQHFPQQSQTVGLIGNRGPSMGCRAFAGPCCSWFPGAAKKRGLRACCSWGPSMGFQLEPITIKPTSHSEKLSKRSAIGNTSHDLSQTHQVYWIEHDRWWFQVAFMGKIIGRLWKNGPSDLVDQISLHTHTQKGIK